MKRFRLEIPGRFILFVLASLAIILLFVSYTTGFDGGYVRRFTETIFLPMEKGIDMASERITLSKEQTATLKDLKKENENLKNEVERLSSELSGVALQQSELIELRSLLALKNTYNSYETTGAYVIGTNASNWFNSFTIDKGYQDGIKENMNVLAGEGLVGIVTKVGKNYSVVRTIIDDSSNVSATVSKTGDNLIVKGSLQSMTESGMISFSNLEDKEKKVQIGDTLVTSNISDKYVPGILIGYITELTEDPNGLTMNGAVAPVCDFKHINEVLVVLTVKESGEIE